MARRRASWIPTLDEAQGPKYLQIADALAEDIYAGRLAIGDRLPTHRDLAWDLKVTVGTVSRAYAEAERRGLIVGEVGRGSFVRAGARSAFTLASPDDARIPSVELGINRPPTSVAVAAFAEALAAVANSPDLAELINYQAHTGRWEHRVAGAALLRDRGLEVEPDQVLIVSGVEHGLAAALMAFCDPGETLLVESLTWSGTRALANLLRLNLHPVAMDAEGLSPNALEEAILTSGARTLYLNPTIHNPTSTVLPAERRARVAEIAARYNLTVVEDDVYGLLHPEPPPPVAHYAPERTIYLTGASKALAPGLRVGYAAMPEDRVGRFSAAARATNWMAPPVMVEIATRWIHDGTAQRLLAEVREEIARRQAVFRERLAGHDFSMAPGSLHAWLPLPEPWRVQEFIAAAAGRGVALTSTDLFVPGRVETPHAIRVTLTATETIDALAQGLEELAELLRGPPEPLLAVV